MAASLRTGSSVLPSHKSTVRLLLLVGAMTTTTAFAAGLEVRVSGVQDMIAENVRNFVYEPWFNESSLSSAHRRRLFTEGAEERSVQALRPFGHYAAIASGTLEADAAGDGWILTLQIDPGPAMRVDSAHVALEGEGSALPELVEWRDAWPLPAEAVLDQTTWEAQKQSAIDIAAAEGYLQARFSSQRIELDLERQVARLKLVLDTGTRARMGAVSNPKRVVAPTSVKGSIFIVKVSALGPSDRRMSTCQSSMAG